jgi:hypothetical protein
MPKQRKKSLPSPNSQSTLPISKEALSVLLRAVEKLLDFLEPNHDAQRTRLSELKRTLLEPGNIVQQRPFLQAITAASDDRFAKGGPSASAIVPYVDLAALRRLREREQAARDKMAALERARPAKVQDWKPCIEAFAEVVAADADILYLFRDLQQRVMRALDATEQPGEELRLTVPEITKYIFGSKIHGASRDSSERLVRKWIQEGRISAKRTKRGLYTVRTSDLEILKDVNQ